MGISPSYMSINSLTLHFLTSKCYHSSMFCSMVYVLVWNKMTSSFPGTVFDSWEILNSSQSSLGSNCNMTASKMLSKCLYTQMLHCAFNIQCLLST